MTPKDIELLIHICKHSLRKSDNLNKEQISDISKLIDKLQTEQFGRAKNKRNERRGF